MPLAAVPAPTTIGVLGAGTMGAGIAQLACQSGARTLLHDPDPAALERGVAAVERGLSRRAIRAGRSAGEADAARARLEPVAELGALAGCELVIEAAPESLELKSALFARLAREVVPEECVLATNTSSLSVTAIAAAVAAPERVVGMHFFNPPPVMPLLEVVAGAASGERALALARATGEAMGKRVIDAADVAGFLVNRCNRPFSLEALRLVEEGIAGVEQVDRIMRQAGAFRLGPFELMDLIGIDVNHAVAESFHRQSYGEPRYRPSPLAARKVAAGQLGRKTGRGWYRYGEDAERREDGSGGAAGVGSGGAAGTQAGGAAGTVLIAGRLPVADELRELAGAAGWDVSTGTGATETPWLVLDLRGVEEARAVPLGDEAPRAVSLHDSSLHARDPAAAGFHPVAPLAQARLVEITRTPVTRPVALARLQEFLASLGLAAEEVGDAPGLVLGRIVCQLINEAAFLLAAGLGTAEDVDAGMELGVSHPRGPIAWSQRLGNQHTVAVLDALHRELGDPRYRVAPPLRRALALGRAGL